MRDIDESIAEATDRVNFYERSMDACIDRYEADMDYLRRGHEEAMDDLRELDEARNEA